jgi:hypothetical protein
VHLRILHMAFVFGGGDKTTPPPDPVQNCKRVIQKAVRRLAGEHVKMEREVKKCVALVRQAVRNGNAVDAKAQAVELVQIRSRLQANKAMQSKFGGMASRLHTMASTQQMTTSMRQMTQAMSSINADVNVESMFRIMTEFEDQNTITTEKQEMLNDTLSDLTEVEQQDAMADETIELVLAEFGLEMPSAPVSGKQTREENENEQQLQKRLELLRL